MWTNVKKIFITVLILNFAEIDLVVLIVNASQDTKEVLLIVNVKVRTLRIHLYLWHYINKDNGYLSCTKCFEFYKVCWKF